MREKNAAPRAATAPGREESTGYTATVAQTPLPASYTAEFANGHRATLLLASTGANISWTPDLPRHLQGEARERFLSAYRIWRDDCLADWSKRTGLEIGVLEL
jgi:hypothetical protein